MVVAAHCLQLSLQLPHPQGTSLPALPAGMQHRSRNSTCQHLPRPQNGSLPACRHTHMIDKVKLEMLACLTLLPNTPPQLKGAGLFTVVAAV